MPPRKFPLFLVIAGVVLAAIGAKWGLLDEYGFEVPHMDQWVAETVFTIEPWLNDSFDAWKAFWWAHNEHRIGLTRFWSLFLTLANGQWDPLFISTINAVFHSVVIGGILFIFRKQLRGPAWILAPAAMATLLVVPLSWENTLFSFQVQFYFLVAAGALHIAGVATHPVKSWRWWLGMLAGVAGLGSVASFFLAPVAALGARLVSAIHNRRWTGSDTATTIACSVLIGVGVHLFNPIARHAELKAQSTGGLLESLSHILAFPAHGVPLLLVVLQAPIAWWLIEKLKTKEAEWTAGDSLLLAFAAWAALLALATAYSRGNVVYGISSRYLDLFSLLVLVNALALGQLWVSKAAYPRSWLAATGAIWALVFAWGVQTDLLWWKRTHLDLMPGLARAYEKHLRAFVLTDDAVALRAVPLDELPLPSYGTLIERLRNPQLRTVLPAAIRAPVPFEPQSNDGFVKEIPANLRATSRGREALYSDGNQSAEWTSEPFSCASLSGVLRIALVGNPATETNRVSIMFDGDLASAATVHPGSAHEWQTVEVVIPRNTKTIQIRANAGPDGASLAFLLPVEVGRGSWLASRARGWSDLLFWIGMVLLGTGLFSGFIPPRRLQTI